MPDKNPVKGVSAKHKLINSANKRIVIMTSLAASALVFAIFAVSAILKQVSYNNKVISEKKTALKMLKSDKDKVDKLVESYSSFAKEPVNIIGGNPTGIGPKDGDNPRIVLDSLPSQYDFPAYATSIEKLIQNQGGITISALGGTDKVDSAASPAGSNVTATEMSMPVTVTAPYQKIKDLVKTMESSIRPLYIDNMRLSGSDGSMSLSMSLKTFYQPEKKFDVTTKVIK